MFTGFIVNHRGKSTCLVFEITLKTFLNTKPTLPQGKERRVIVRPTPHQQREQMEDRSQNLGSC